MGNPYMALGSRRMLVQGSQGFMKVFSWYCAGRRTRPHAHSAARSHIENDAYMDDFEAILKLHEPDNPPGRYAPSESTSCMHCKGLSRKSTTWIQLGAAPVCPWLCRGHSPWLQNGSKQADKKEQAHYNNPWYDGCLLQDFFQDALCFKAISVNIMSSLNWAVLHLSWATMQERPFWFQHATPSRVNIAGSCNLKTVPYLRQAQRYSKGGMFGLQAGCT